MFGRYLALLIFALLLIFTAGCTSSGPAPQPVPVTPTPQVIDTTAPVTPTTAPTTAPTEVPTTKETAATESGPALEGTLMITIPPLGDNPDQTENQLEVSVDGGDIGEVNSSTPLTLRLPVGPHDLQVGDYGKRSIKIDFGKVNSQMYGGEGAAGSSLNIGTRPTEKTRTFNGAGNSVRSFEVNGGGYVFSAVYYSDDVFSVDITDAGGNSTESLFDEGGPYSGSKIVNLPKGEYNLVIQTTGSYTLEMSQA